MSDQAPKTPPPGDRPTRAEDPVPNPHRTEATPPPEEGMRPGIDPAVRPEQDEPLGPAAGLVTAAGAKAEEEAAEISGSEDPEAEALLAKMGVEEEGIESGQLLGLIAAVLLSVAALIVVLIFLFYIPERTATGREAEAAMRATEQEILQTEAEAKLRQYSRTDSTYGLPISRAMGLVAAEYGAAEGAEFVPATRQEWNTLPAEWGIDAAAVQDVPGGIVVAPFRAPNAVRRTAPDAIETVGVDRETDETVELIENDAEVDADAADVVPDPIDDLE